MSEVGGRRDLEREHQPRTLKVAGESEPRPSRADERLLTDQAREREAVERAERLGEVERRVRHAQQAIDSLRNTLRPTTRATYRDLDQARRALVRIQAREVSSRLDG